MFILLSVLLYTSEWGCCCGGMGCQHFVMPFVVCGVNGHVNCCTGNVFAACSILLWLQSMIVNYFAIFWRWHVRVGYKWVILNLHCNHCCNRVCDCMYLLSPLLSSKFICISVNCLATLMSIYPLIVYCTLHNRPYMFD